MCFGGGNANMSNQQKNSEANKQAAGTRMASGGNYVSPKTSFQQVKDDIQMDLGIKPKDVDYYARLDDRAARSKAAMENLGKDIFGRPASDDSPAPAPTPTPEVKPVAEAPEVPQAPQAPAMTTAEVQAPLKEEEVGVGTAASGEAEAAQIEAEAGGEAEKKVAGTAKTSRRSTVQTSAQGLLTEAPTRRRRALMNKMIA
tara:strand:+ start:583 stop:1182 length:600 start_codon:yes stop_codon:yes gene_type:complete